MAGTSILSVSLVLSVADCIVLDLKMITKKYYNEIAISMFRSKPDREEMNFASRYAQWWRDCNVLANLFALDNERFIENRFLQVCRNGY